MTYEGLIVCIADSAPSLKPASLQLLLHLIALAIKTGTCRIAVSQRSLGTRLNLSREGVAIAMRGIAHLVKIEYSHGSTSIFVMPEDWFTLQRSFSESEWPGTPGQSGQLSRPEWPTFQATSGQPDGAEWPGTPGHSGQLSRPQWPTKTAKVANSTRPQWPTFQASSTQDNGVTASPSDQIRSESDQNLSSSSFLISQIKDAEMLDENQAEAATLLREMLIGYMHSHRPPGEIETAPTERILARCLAIANVNSLGRTLRTLSIEGKVAGRKYAWFVTVFAQRIYGISPKALNAALELARLEKKCQSEPQPLFGHELVQFAAGGVRKIG